MNQNTENTRDEAITVIDFTADKHRKRMRKEMVEYFAFTNQMSKIAIVGEALDLWISFREFSEAEVRSYFGDRAIPLHQAMTEMRSHGLEMRAAAKDRQQAV